MVTRVVGAGHEHDHRGAPALGERDAEPRGRRGRGSDARDDLERDPRGAHGFDLLAEAPEDRGITALQPHDAHASPGPVDQQPVDLALADADAAGRLADIDDRGARRDLVEQLSRDQPVVQDDLGLAEPAQPLHGDELGIARAGADERDDAALHASSFRRSPRGKKRIKRSSTAGRSSHGTSSRIFWPARGSCPPRPPTNTWTPSTILPSTFTLHPCRPTSAVWWLPQDAGQPDHLTVSGRVVSSCRSKSRASANARVFVSM